MEDKKDNKPKVVASFKVDGDLLEEAKLVASLLGVTVSATVETLLRDWVKKSLKQIPPDAIQSIEALRKAVKKKPSK
jgi:antitoxin component of RelBE/YafQ-DinJ toxin-antitoxin module